MAVWIRKVVKGTLIAKAVVVALVVLLVGGSQLLLRQLPAHQDEVKAWVASKTGLALEFSRLDASWSWRGPELAFRDASVKAVGGAAPFLTARGANVGFNPFRLLVQLVLGRQLGVDRLTFEGTELTLVKTENGAYRLQGAPVGSAGADSAPFRVPPDIDVLVRDSRVLYLDPARSVAWSFQDVAGSMRRDGDLLKLEASATPPHELAARIGITLQAFIATHEAAAAKFTGDWRLSADVKGVDLAAAAQVLPATTPGLLTGAGDLAVWLEWRAGALVGGNVDLALANVGLPRQAGYQDPDFERVAFHGDWQRDGDHWHVALKDLNVTHATRNWPSSGSLDLDVALRDGALADFGLRGSFLRIEDLTSFVTALPESRWRQMWLALAPRGDLRDFELTIGQRPDAQLEYSVAGQFEGLGVLPYEKWPGVNAFAGAVHADAHSGRLELASTNVTLDWPGRFRSRLEVSDLHGILVWRAGQDAVRVVSDDLVAVTHDASLRSNLELTVPMDGSSPRLDLRTDVSAFDIAAAPRYLPVGVMPDSVVEWLDTGLRGGRVEGAEVTFVGPLQAFPFDGGEGEFRATLHVDGGQLAYVSDWPIAEDLHGTVEFVNASFDARGKGRVLGNRSDDVHVTIPDLRTGELRLAGETSGPLGQVLAFLNEAPLISRYLGPNFTRLTAPTGKGDVSLDLQLPLRNKEDYKLNANLKVQDGELAFQGLDPHATEIEGSLALVDGALHGEGIKGIFLDGPVTAAVNTVDTPGYRAKIDFDGEVTIDAVVTAFNLPYRERLAGQTAWQGSLLIPAATGDLTPPAQITVDSNLAGVALRFPEPFAKAPGDPTNLEVEMTFPEHGMEMRGYVGPARRFALDFDVDPGGQRRFKFRRAALQFGGALPEFRADTGVTLDGSLPQLRVDDWMALSDDGTGASRRSHWSSAFSGAELEVADFYVFGQQLGRTKVAARRRTDDWQFELDSDAIAGTLLVPMDLARDPQVVAVMRRLYLNSGGNGGQGRTLDPRELPGVQLHADEFGIGQRQLGRLDAEILSDPLGLRLVSFESSTDAFSAQGSGGWFVGADGDTTRLAASVTSTNVGKMLDQLGFSHFVEAETAEVTASVHWPGPPSSTWLDHLGGDLSLKTKKGSLIEVEPGGAGRFAGLLSFGALPRRLALDFRDVFNKGFVFDEITADFVIVDGNAFTDNLKLTGPVADVGMIGRTGLRDRDYRQQAIVTAEPGKMLPTVGALIAGPVGAAALLIFSKIFKKPLAGIGRASYCVTGSWQEPKVERLTDEQLEKGPMCAELPPGGMPQAQPGVAAR